MLTVQNDCLAWLLFSLYFSGNHRGILKSIGDEVSGPSGWIKKIKCFIMIITHFMELGHHVRLLKKAFMYTFLSYQFDVFLCTVENIRLCTLH